MDLKIKINDDLSSLGCHYLTVLVKYDGFLTLFLAM